MVEIEGIVPVVPTPFDNDGCIDEEGLRKLVDFCVAGGACAICLPAYVGEFYKLSEHERHDVVRIAVEAGSRSNSCDWTGEPSIFESRLESRSSHGGVRGFHDQRGNTAHFCTERG